MEFLKKHRLFYGIAGLLIFLSFAFNIFGVGPTTDWFGEFENYSEGIARNTIDCSQKGDYKGNLVTPYAESGNTCQVYPSQFGLQGYIYGALAHLPISKSVVVIVIKMALVLLMTLTVLLFVLFSHRQFGFLVATVLTGFLMLSDWLAGFSANMYWTPFLMLLPFIFSLFAYPRVMQGQLKLWKFLVGIGVLFLLKFLNGYEYSSVIAISVASAIVYWELKAKTKVDIKHLAKRFLGVALTSVAALAIALVLNVVSLVNDFGSLSKAANVVSERGLARAEAKDGEYKLVGLYNFINMNPEVYKMIDSYYDLDRLYDGQASPITYFAINIMSYLLLPVISLPIAINGLVGVLVGSFVFWLALGLLVLGLSRKKKLINTKEYRAFLWAVIVSLLGLVSWFVLAPGHTYVHAHINAIMLYLPLVLWLYLIVAIGITLLVKRKWPTKAR